MATHESRPNEGGSRAHPHSSPPSAAVDWLDYSHAGHLAGHSLGFAQGQRCADEDRALAIVHAYACRMAGIAVRTAREHYGEGWSSEIARQASGMDW